MFLIILICLCAFSFSLGLILGKNASPKIKAEKSLYFEEDGELEDFLSYDGSVQ